MEARLESTITFPSMLRYACSFTVKVISHPDNSTSFEVIESQLENPLIDADHQDLLAMKQIPVPGGHHHKTHHKRNQTDDHDREYPLPAFPYYYQTRVGGRPLRCGSNASTADNRSIFGSFTCYVSREDSIDGL